MTTDPTPDGTAEARADAMEHLVKRAVRPIDIEHDQLMARAEAEHQARVTADQARAANDRSAVLLWAADAIDRKDADQGSPESGVRWATAELRRLAAGERGEQQPDTEMLPASTAPLAARLPLVKGNCPACRHASLFLGTGGYPTCSNHECTEPDAATTVLEQYGREAHAPSHAWKVESPRRDKWASWGATYDERHWAQQVYESAIEHAAARPFRLVRATTTYTVEAEHAPAAPVAGQPPADTGEEAREEIECANCWRLIENRGTPSMDGNHSVHWVHVPGGFTVCFPQRGADSPRAEPELTVAPQPETVHGCPPDGSGLTPCCGRTPFELPLTDRISSEAPVTCKGADRG